MSGTSRDGLDLAACLLRHEQGSWTYDLLAAESIAYDQVWQERLGHAMQLPATDLLALDVDLGRWMGQQANQFIVKHELKPDVLCSHGHTVHHQPECGFTHQIGNPHLLHAATGIPVVADFRQADIALGGQGAPLVPVGDQLLFADYEVCLNLGGIANLSLAHQGQRLAFDIAPANLVLNSLAQREGLPYDEGGRLAFAGRHNKALAAALDALPYYGLTGPRSIGEELVKATYLPLLAQFEAPTTDLLHTYGCHVARQIARAIQQASPALAATGYTLLLTGGGALNAFLVEKIGYYCGSEVSVRVPEQQVIEFKEAIVFALLGVLRLRGETNTLASVTGASEDSCGGVLVGTDSGKYNM